MEKTNFDRIAASTGTMATFLSSLPTMTGPWDEAFDRHFCATCSVQDCNAEGCPHKQVRDSVIRWWLGLNATADSTEGSAGHLHELLERATPKAPIKEKLADRACPACGAYISWDALNDPLDQAPKFCKECGQALDWSEEDGE